MVTLWLIRAGLLGVAGFLQYLRCSALQSARTFRGRLADTDFALKLLEEERPLLPNHEERFNRLMGNRIYYRGELHTSESWAWTTFVGILVAFIILFLSFA